MERDRENITYIHSIETLYSPQGFAFQREKYLPKITFLEKRFGDRFPEVSVLDVGIGYGVFLHILEHEFGLEHLFGMDPFPGSIEKAARFTSADIRQGDIMDERWPFNEHSFDVVTCFDVVEHLEEPAVFFAHVKRFMREGSILVMTTPNKDLPYRMRSVPLLGIPDPNPTHINVRPSAYWKRLATSQDFRIVDAWKGEHLTHIRFVPKVLSALCRLLRLDHRRIPLVRTFEQSFCMVLEITRG
ncbi:MAG: class I SAM-dependent methyltransferase [bacterium]|nr:MAG: class I SAM-dependent methyltransferase [bacterium]